MGRAAEDDLVTPYLLAGEHVIARQADVRPALPFTLVFELRKQHDSFLGPYHGPELWALCPGAASGQLRAVSDANMYDFSTVSLKQMSPAPSKSHLSL